MDKSQIATEVDKLNEELWGDRNNHTSDLSSLVEQGHTLALQHNYRVGIAQCLLINSYQQLRQSDFKNSLVNAQKALKIFDSHGKSTFHNLDKELDKEKWLQRCQNTLSVIYGQMGDFNKAQQLALQSYKLAKKLGLKKSEADALLNLAIIYGHFGEYDSALEHNFQSLNIYQSLGEQQSEIKILLNIGVIYFDLGRFESALMQFEKAESLSQDDDNPNKRTYALICSNLGRTYHRLKENHKAIEYQEKSHAILKELEDRSGLSYLYDEIGKRLLDNKKYQEAEKHLRNSLVLKRTIEDKKGEVDTALHIGNLYAKQGRHYEAIKIFNHALTLAEKVEARKEQVEAFLGLSKSYEAQGSFEKALHNLKKHTDSKDVFLNQNSDQRFQALRIKNEIDQTENEMEIYRLKNVELVKLNQELQKLTLELEKQAKELEKQAKEDALTKLYNRRHFEAVLHTVYAESIQDNKAMSVMICDIDNFKSVNDTFSHATGDIVLVKVAELLKTHTREIDTVARYGGEEFVIIFPETTAENSAVICNRLQTQIASYAWDTIKPNLKVTVSIGICQDTTLGSGEAMISQADSALYEVKRNGKNHIRIWQNSQTFIWSKQEHSVSLN